ncbi:MAG: DUF6206 family protein [Acidimicrobiia bacterium]
MITDAALAGLEREVQSTLERADASALRVLGYGEISLVLGWPSDEPRWACKRLPPFPSSAAADGYAAVLGRYLDELGHRGVRVLDTEVGRVALTGGVVALYVVQPVLPSDSLAISIVTRGDEQVPALLGDVVDAALGVVDDRVGLDAQLSNWAVHEDRLTYFDVTTPMLRGADGSPELDTEVFLASLPRLLRGPVRRHVLPGILQRYHEPRSVVLDLAANLVKERLGSWIPTVLAAAGDRLEPALVEDEVRRDYRSDARTWALLQALRRVDRAWQRRVRRRPYAFLLPDRIERSGQARGA